ncbi:hypothetical protein E2C01_080169 [Portunus trituberculatus]|uniref:Uncharacterized protein n=1 Tax=Portunus trituberculatus TaxID=210409 RepID=A0A5B7IVA8_PORTR|nr:hypothetical protein [Portunus trituberculatus]
MGSEILEVATFRPPFPPLHHPSLSPSTFPPFLTPSLLRPSPHDGHGHLTPGKRPRPRHRSWLRPPPYDPPAVNPSSTNTRSN